MRYLAVDYGKKRIGIAICDAGEMIASPFSVIEGRHQLVEKIAQIISGQKVEGGIVVGMPLNMDDTKGSAAKAAEEFARQLKNKLNVPVFLQDERLSSFEAEEKIASAEYTFKKKRKRLDAVAAAHILAEFLESKDRYPV